MGSKNQRSVLLRNHRHFLCFELQSIHRRREEAPRPQPAELLRCRRLQWLHRFIKGSEAFLGQPEDSVVVDFNYYRADDPLSPRLSQDVWEEVEQMAFFKHGARSHWGKNRGRSTQRWTSFLRLRRGLIRGGYSAVGFQMR
ncbi:hypothetical protein AXF42_Ash006106 [Apostasia shenzhenica]|uniref:D-arabinono-1,4-lactone oxidase C-terminal domain-containing protein n=1 Tax=Apostasia shenzhenica TaxID=1088818 RepID=A0A2I0B0A9_9ASPA|nr:hypothetical protein AXF42_Ash006106 [Apostasia shenzhenica]